MPQPRSTGAVPTATRLLLGIAAFGFSGAGLFYTLSGTHRTVGGVLLRVGLLFSAAWLVAPAVRRPSLATAAFLLAGALVLIRPRLILVVALAAVLWRFGRRRA